ncbi:MAG: hypothetical protein ACOYXR_02420 [Nitrospirota bacterium]
MMSVIERMVRLRLTHTERVVGATVLAGMTIFVGILIDLPTVQRAKMLEGERRALTTDVAALTVQLDQLAAQRRDVEAEAARTEAAPPDPRVSSFMREITSVEGRPEVQFGSIRPVPPSAEGTAVFVELSAPLKLLGPYLDELERSRWAIRIRDLQLTRNSEQGPSVSARFVAETPVRVRGLEPETPGREQP